MYIQIPNMIFSQALNVFKQKQNILEIYNKIRRYDKFRES